MRAPELLPLLASLLCAAAFAREAPSDSAAPAPAPVFAPAPKPLPEGVSLTLEVEPSELSIGDLFRVTLDVECPAGWAVEMPHGVAQLGDFEVRRFVADDPRIVRRGWQRARWTGELALFGSGVFTLPALSVVLADTASGDVWRLSSDPAVVAVVPRDLDSAADIEADEPPVEISGGIPPWAWAILLPAAAALAAFLLRRRRLRLEAALPPHVRCLREIDRLLARGDGSSDDQARHNAFCLALGLALRGYLDERFGTRPLEKTARELLDELDARSGELEEWKGRIGEFCRRADLVKFAGSRLAEGEAEALAGVVRELVEATKPVEEKEKGR